MSLFQTVQIGQAATDYSKFNLSSDTLTTTDIGEINVVHVLEANIGDKFNVDYRLFGRCAPLVVPTYGDIGQRVVSVFVPYYQIADDADAYISGLRYFAGRTAVGRWIQQKHLDILLYGGYYSPIASGKYSRFLGSVSSDEAKNYSPNNLPINIFCHLGENGTYTYFKLTTLGKQVYKLFRSLGYNFSRSLNFKDKVNGAIIPNVNSEEKLSAYPILCYLKAYADLFMPSSYYQTSLLLKFLHGVKSLDATYCQPTGYVIAEELYKVIDQILTVYYDSDYFTSAWQKPNTPLSTVSATDVQFKDDNLDVTLNTDQVSNRLDLGSTLSQSQLKFLRGFDNFCRRNNLVGFREFNAVYAQFGIKPSEMKANYCQLIDIDNSPLNIGDVTATAQTEDTLLGSYAGKAFQKNNKSINFEAKDYGMFLQITWIYVKPIYFQGIRKHCLRLDPFDFYKPDFDGVGPAAISKRELNAQLPNQVFGFTERYNDYRFSLSNIYGDFELDPQMWSWHTGRYFSQDMNPTAQTNNMLTYVKDGQGNIEFDRIFPSKNASELADFDHFYQIWHFNVSALRKMKNINESLDLGKGNIQLDRNGSV